MMVNSEYISYRITVPKDFEALFSHFYYAKNNTKEPVRKTLFPSYQAIFIFNFGPKASLSSKNNANVKVNKCLTLGPIRQAFDYTLPPDSEILVANFKDDAFYRFFGAAMSYKNIAADPGTVSIDNCFINLWEAIEKLQLVSDRVNLILDFCESYIQPQHQSIVTFVKPMNDFGAMSKIKTIAGNTNQSERTVQIKHKKYLGYSAKEISRYHRFLKAIELIQQLAEAKGKADWFEIIHECGYYDQSQLIHDFKHYVQLTPTQFLKFQQDICYAKPD